MYFPFVKYIIGTLTSKQLEILSKLGTLCALPSIHNTVLVATKQVSKFTKLRISNYRLEVEFVRYSKTPPHLRLCKTCNLNDVENEFHFICVCNAYTRQKF